MITYSYMCAKEIVIARTYSLKPKACAAEVLSEPKVSSCCSKWWFFAFTHIATPTQQTNRRTTNTHTYTCMYSAQQHFQLTAKRIFNCIGKPVFKCSLFCLFHCILTHTRSHTHTRARLDGCWSQVAMCVDKVPRTLTKTSRTGSTSLSTSAIQSRLRHYRCHQFDHISLHVYAGHSIRAHFVCLHQQSSAEPQASTKM